MTTIAQGRVSGLVAVRWFSAGDIGADADWFTEDLKASQEARRRFALDDAFTVVKHTLQIFVPATTIVNIQLKFPRQDVINNGDSLTKVFPLNDNNALTAATPFQFDLMLVQGASYNIQHKAGSQNVAVFITESFNVDI